MSTNQVKPELAFQSVWAAAKELEREMTQIQQALHQWPELGFQEVKTAALIATILSEAGLEVKQGIGGTGVVAECRGKHPGPVIALRADMDALPIQEETGLPYRSHREGHMHACGHDIHTSILLGAAKIVQRHADRLAGTVRFLFQPAEELNAGAAAMMEEGVLEGVSEIYALHNLPGLSAGQVAVRHGSMMASVDRIEITITGRGGHGAIPDQCIDPIVAASGIVSGLQTAVSREISPFESAVVTIGSFHAGDANNVIPSTAELTGTVRTFSSGLQKQMPGKLERIITHIASAHGCQAALRYIPQTPVLAGSEECVDKVKQTAAALLGSDKLHEAAPTMAGEDFANYLQEVPGCLFWLGSGTIGDTNEVFGLHHPKYKADQACLVPGAAMLASLVLPKT
ncbi:M20 metallopeptidase family protein [Paenibacillus silviterrae]|uniref:M20 metallopeptidase family protein n=1 Tax=Paenibacillus silviterrae TaxID=3242194 RepID=UPI002542CDF0|nr:M20 family metallopeptidase [Paenibacillus chinjuensis]